MNELPSISVILAALVTGTMVGSILRTDLERKFRGYIKAFPNIIPASSLWSIICNLIFWIIIGSSIIAVVAISIVQIGGAYPLSQVDKYAFVVMWTVSAGFAKYLRYIYWKNKSSITL